MKILIIQLQKEEERESKENKECIFVRVLRLSLAFWCKSDVWRRNLEFGPFCFFLPVSQD
jgi:hypothetical protein